MSSERTYVDYLRDIRDAAENAETFIRELDYDAFAEDTKTIYAVTRALEIIGEAAKRIPGPLSERTRGPRSTAG